MAVLEMQLKLGKPFQKLRIDNERNLMETFCKQDILNEKFDDTLTATTKSADETIAKLEETIKCGDSELTWDRNVTSYLWDELPGDFPSSGWCMDANQGLLSEMSSLTLKAKGCTPAIRRYAIHVTHFLGFQ